MICKVIEAISFGFRSSLHSLAMSHTGTKTEYATDNENAFEIPALVTMLRWNDKHKKMAAMSLLVSFVLRFNGVYSTGVWWKSSTY